MSQVQCPNCGGYRVSLEKTEGLNWSRGTEWVGTLWLPIIGFVVSAAMLICSGSWGHLEPFDNLSCLIGIFLLWMFTWWAWGKDKLQRDFSTRKRYSYQCLLCGYQWTWTSGEPMPKVNVRPDLIAKGEQRLREAEQDAIAHQMAEDALRRAGLRK